MAPATGLPGITPGVVMTCLGIFGGELLAAVYMGSPAIVLTEKLAFPSAVAAWLVVRGR